MNGEATRFKIGNKAAEKWTEDEVEKKMFQMLENAKNRSDILCFQDAVLSVDLYPSSINYLINKFPVFNSIKEDIGSIIIARVNKGALQGDFNPTASIWRQKQLGEKDQQYPWRQQWRYQVPMNLMILSHIKNLIRQAFAFSTYS